VKVSGDQRRTQLNRRGPWDDRGKGGERVLGERKNWQKKSVLARIRDAVGMRTDFKSGNIRTKIRGRGTGKRKMAGRNGREETFAGSAMR